MQFESPVAHDTSQLPMLHTCPAAQRFPHRPQWALSVCVSRHTPVHTTSPTEHAATHAPAEHCCPLGHAVPHAPQFALSVCVSRHTPEQLVSSVAQLT